MAQLSRESLDFLEHYGVKGMRWGIRSGSGFENRARKAIKKTNNRRKEMLRRIQQGKPANSSERLLDRASARAQGGVAQRNANFERQIKQLDEQTARVMKKGQVKVLDILDLYGKGGIWELLNK